MSLFRSVVFVFLLICASKAKYNRSDVIGFPEPEENPDLINKDNRQPVYTPAMCKDNELFYPGDQQDDWICDCRPAYLYHPQSDACWPAYQKGPCAEGEYLIMKSNSDIPVCEKNPCVVSGFVSWNGNCEKLGAVEPCKFMYPVAAALGVNSTSLVISCVRLSGVPMSSEPAPLKVCPLGCKRSIAGKCEPCV